MTQGLLALSAALAAPAARGQVVGAAQGGVVIGLLLARTVAGLVADAWGWRAVYVVSAALAALLAWVLARRLPHRRLPVADLSYWALLRSLYALMAREPRLLDGAGVAAVGAAVFLVAHGDWRVRAGGRAGRVDGGARRPVGGQRAGAAHHRSGPAAAVPGLGAHRLAGAQPVCAGTGCIDPGCGVAGAAPAWWART
ncbi:hypothetical protein G6F62_013382 [Rhizopus arrhizus]|nr:hypothetical protein G6F62_013382 [Rhizopus arrhizus]